jgi:hypothetical protein
MPAAILTGMRRFALPVLFLSILVQRGLGSDAIRGDFVGTWSGSSGAGGKFRLSVGEQEGKTKCTVSFDYAGEEVKTNVTLCKIDNAKIEVQYDYDFSGNRLQSTIHGGRKGTGMEGTYHAIALANGAAVDDGDWKAAPVQ